MALILRDLRGQSFVEGTPGERLIARVEDVVTVIEGCFAHGVNRVLLYAENLPEAFFDLRSGQAGAILQKLRTYHIRLALVRSPDVALSQRFSELLVDEQRGLDFRLFEERDAAATWLCSV
jgi:hypothetical protein